MKEAKLKQCPFCGKKAEIKKRVDRANLSNALNYYTVQCTYCTATIGSKSKEQAISIWNSRIGEGTFA